ncbi:uncharacterized protein RCO7_00232 [Rhynchosporium graminicola]|uniref:Utp8 beta-propeller domain-containing protein n=1 Tax=Rhynchosporium graminicola TaxID=2792576 RepID=A0A1E1KHD3_9HELO|nr:uncharacterized protein RCO7_00232 [Rhynchosporium commune]
MSSRFVLQKPYVVATLPRPIDHSKGQYVVAEVYGGAPGAKKRKRSELAVGIDGEGVNLYDISSSRLVTSYALPPQSSFTCPPSSLRSRVSKKKVERRTYVSTRGSQSELTMFYESIDGSESAILSSKTSKLEHSLNPILYLGTITAPRSSGISENTTDVLAVKENGEVQCYDGDTLEEKWTSPPVALTRDAAVPASDLKVEFAQVTNAFSASQGILRGRQDVFALFPQEVVEDGFNPDLLVLITWSGETESRTLHVVNLPRRSSAYVQGMKYSVESLLQVDIPSGKPDKNTKPVFHIQVSVGILQQLHGDALTTFDLTGTLPKQQSVMISAEAQSFLRLSNTAVMVSSKQSATVYNPKYQSKLSTIGLDMSSEETLKRKRNGLERIEGGSNHTCRFVSYFPKLGVAIAIIDKDLVGIQIEGQQDRHGKTRTAGLLIDSLGCAAKEQLRPGRDGAGSTKKAKLSGMLTLDSFLPGTIGLGQPWAEKIVELEGLFAKGECDELKFDEKIETHLGADWGGQVKRSKVVGPDPDAMDLTTTGESAGRAAIKRRFPASDVDRRWILYALSKIFTWTSSGEGQEPMLSISFYPMNTFMWLTTNGYMTIANIEAALRSNGTPIVSIPAGQLVRTLVEVDPDMDLLYAVVAKNYLSAPEILHAIRKLMESLGLLGDSPSSKQGLLTNGDDAEPSTADVGYQVAKAEYDLETAEYQLGPGSGTRGAALSAALSRLYSCPSGDITLALQTILTSQEIVCLIYLFRFELARGGWTTRYTDSPEQLEMVDEDADIQDNAIVVIASLLNNCIDAVGTVGWLSGEARLVDNDLFEAEELISSLKLEVSAALEGIEEAVCLRSVISELVKYAESFNRSLTQQPKDSKKANDVPSTLPSDDQDIRALPISLRAEKQISLLKVGAGGAVHKRTARDIGFLKSQKVGKYSRERITL